ncbi:hypothetical protein [Corynebacterium epidermidicanis]|uniref:Uncharacterized protein n=1 Tax=Corynebacterium epidermidicanis TaxID=1050174 RepID=A0A0G3GM72_9CORY|nr:hypothetical protein [Corynebacterium epidermidicanis]AKK02331.1 hypothetical protein CEPID_02250 [Corynebacterium epidermidicanis]
MQRIEAAIPLPEVAVKRSKRKGPHVRIRIDKTWYRLTTAEAYTLANRLVDAAEEVQHRNATKLGKESC